MYCVAKHKFYYIQHYTASYGALLVPIFLLILISVLQVFLLPGAGSEVYGLLAHRSPLQDQAHLILYLPEWWHDCADTLYLSVVLICSYLSWQHTSIKLHRHLVTSIFMCVLLRTNLLKLPIWKGKLPFRAPSHLCLFTHNV